MYTGHRQSWEAVHAWKRAPNGRVSHEVCAVTDRKTERQSVSERYGHSAGPDRGGCQLRQRLRHRWGARQRLALSACTASAQGVRMATRKGLLKVLALVSQPLSIVEGVLVPLQPRSLLQPVRATGSSHTTTLPVSAAYILPLWNASPHVLRLLVKVVVPVVVV